MKNIVGLALLAVTIVGSDVGAQSVGAMRNLTAPSSERIEAARNASERLKGSATSLTDSARVLERLGEMTFLSDMTTADSSREIKKAAEKVSTTATKSAQSSSRPWLGSQIGYTFAGDGDFSDNFLVGGALLYEIPMDSTRWFRLPIVGNIGKLAASGNDSTREAKAQTLLNATEGVFVRVEPYWRKTNSRRDFSATFYLSGGWKVNVLKDTASKKQTFTQGRVSILSEFNVGLPTEGARPLTISFAPIYSLFSASAYQQIFGERKSSLRSLQSTVVIPVASGAGAIFESVATQGQGPVTRFGILLGAEPKK